jgi:hypothetical protein
MRDALRKLDDWWLKQNHGWSHYFDKNGVPLSLGQFVALFEDVDYRRVAYTDLGHAQISTVWLGIDHDFSFFGGKKGPPIIFETMVFGLLADLDLTDRDTWRYSTLEQAQAGHEQVVAEVERRIEELLRESE